MGGEKVLRSADMTKQFSQEDFEAEFKAWLAKGGKKEIAEAMTRARRTSEDFSRVTRVRTETLYEPVAF